MSMSCVGAGGTPLRGAIGGWMVSATKDVGQYQVGPPLANPQALPSSVQLIKHVKGGKFAMVKRYNIEKGTEGEDKVDPIQYITHEVVIMKQFQHEGILPCIAAFVSGPEVWLVTPLMPYGSVSDLMKAHFSDGLPELACAMITRDLCHALTYLHRQGVVHRALRASHVLISDTGAAVLGGLRYCTELHVTGENRSNLYSFPLHGVTGNLSWLAPEILQQNLLGYNETSDIYSLAVTLCEMANGLIPFSEMAPTLMLLEKLRGAAPKLMDASTMGEPPGPEEVQEQGLLLHPADSGVGDSVGSCSNGLSRESGVYYSRQFSPNFHSLVTECSVLDSQLRPSAMDLLAHPFLKQVKKTPASLVALLHPIQPLIQPSNIPLVTPAQEQTGPEEPTDAPHWKWD